MKSLLLGEYLQQGDVIIEKCQEIPKEAKAVKPRKHKGYVLADGETTGHCHAISETKYTSLFLVGSTMYLKVEHQVEIKHEEHKKLSIPIGIYTVRQVREYDHFLEEARAVRD